MQRREWLFSALGVLATGLPIAAEVIGRRVNPRPDIETVRLPAGDYWLDVGVDGDPLRGLVTYFYATLVPAAPDAFYGTRPLERLRASGMIEPNEPRQGFFPTRARPPDSDKTEPDAFFRIVTVRVGKDIYRIASEAFWFLVNGNLVLGSEVSAASFDIKPADTVSVVIAPGATGQLL
ncbi:MAG: hypothetical protein HY398_00555 [Candidatus Doudnabacteria bacterium]|nr:hypothetical protein [Candidatus Doudnabacteria bacterium]